MRQLNLLCPAFATLLSAFWTGSALAHAHPDRYLPAPGSTLHQPPAAVTIHFDTQLEPIFSTLKVADAQGRQVSVGQGAADRANARVMNANLEPLGAGMYQVQWLAVAHDGHRTQGNYRFSVL